MCTGAACTGTWAGVVAETLLVCWAGLQREEFNWTSDLLSGAFWPQYLAGLTVTEGFYRAVMQWVSAGAGIWHWSCHRSVSAHPGAGFATRGGTQRSVLEL